MQAVSSTLADAINAPVRHPLVRLRVDWDRSGSFTDLAVKDLSADVTGVRYSNELATDLPAEAKLFAGSAAGEVTVTLAHQGPDNAPEQHGGWYYSPANSASPLAAYDRKAAPVLLEVGCLTEAGPEYLTLLHGSIRSLEAVSSGKTATLRIADGSESMRGQVRLPPVIADGASASALLRPGLNATFLVDWTARACGYYASPPARAGCKFLATMHGSGYPEVGSLEAHYGANGSKLSYSPTPEFPTAARWVQAVNTDGSAGQATNYRLGGAGTLSTNNGASLLIQGWWRFNSAAADQPLLIVHNNDPSGTATSSNPYVSLFYQGALGGAFTLTFNRGGADATHRSIAGPTISPGTGWHYYAVLVSFTSTQVTATFRVDSTTTGPTSTATPSVTGAPALQRVYVNRGRVGAFTDAHLNGLAEDVQVTTESTIGPGWDNAYTPTALINVSAALDNRLVATPVVREEGWAILQELARAEFATVSFDEQGRLVWWPRDRWTRAPYTTVQATVTTDTLKELALAEATDQVINAVVIRAQVPQVSAQQTVWKLGNIRSIYANGSLTILANLANPAGNIDTSVVYGTALGSSRYLAGTEPGGGGAQATNLTFVVTQLDPEVVKLEISNPNAVRVFLSGDADASATYAGVPYVWLDGQSIIFGNDASDGASSGTRVEARDAASIARFGEQLWEAPDSQFRQDDDDLQALADDLLADLADPLPAIQDIPVVGNPRWQLGDRIRVVDLDGLALDGEFHLSKIDLEVTPGEGMAATVSLRGA